MPRKVRDIVGLDDDAAIDEREMEELIRIAQQHVRETLFTYHYDEQINANPDDGNTWNGSNTKFQSSVYPIMDSDFDFTVDSNDVTARWIDTDYTPQTATVAVSNPTYGILTITQDGSTAIPATAETVTIDYYSFHKNVTRLQLENLTTYLTAHLVQQRLKSGTSLSMADFEKNRPIILKSPTQYRDTYYLLLENLRGDTIRGV